MPERRAGYLVPMTNTANEPRHPGDDQALNDDSQTAAAEQPSADAPTPDERDITDGEVDGDTAT